jgi:hypothetical protein
MITQQISLSKSKCYKGMLVLEAMIWCHVIGTSLGLEQRARILRMI